MYVQAVSLLRKVLPESLAIVVELWFGNALQLTSPTRIQPSKMHHHRDRYQHRDGIPSSIAGNAFEADIGTKKTIAEKTSTIGFGSLQA